MKVIHNHISNDATGDHYGVSINSDSEVVLVQLQADGEQVRLALNPDQARQMAALLVKNASMLESDAVGPDADAMFEFVLANGLPMRKEGQYRYHGVSEPIWHATQLNAIYAAMREIQVQGQPSKVEAI